MKRRRLWINLALVLAIVLVLGAIVGIALRPEGASAPARTATVVSATVSSTVTASGSVESAGDINLAFTTPGIVTSIEVAAGDSVNQGQVLATINQTTATQQLSAAQATLSQALSSASTSSSSVSNAQVQLKLTSDAAAASNDSLKAAVLQARSNLSAAEKLWTDACVNPDDATCPNASAAEAIRSAQNGVKSAQINYDAAVTAAANAATAYDLAVNQAAETLTQTKSVGSTTCTAYGASSVNCASATSTTLSAQHAYDSAVATQTQSKQADSQTVQKSAMALSTANVTLRKAIADQSKLGSDSVRTASQALTNAVNAQEKGKIANAQSVQSAQNLLTNAQAAILTLGAGDTAAAPTVAQAAIDSAKAAVAVAQRALADTTLVAPVAGTIGSVNITAGEISTSGATTSGGSAAITVIPDGLFTVSADFAETDAAQVTEGDLAAVTFPAISGALTTGVVLAVDPMATTSASSSLVVFSVKVSMDSVPAGVQPGMSASISITTDEVSDVLAVPQSAIATIGEVSAVEVLQPDNTSLTAEVTLGLKGDSLTEITSGVTAGQILVIPTGGTSVFPTGGVPGGGGPFSRPRN
ncbi:MAG: biotin/lipoyl-binding protein [Actinomycetes bacterium]